MPSPSIEEILVITPEVERMLGKTAAQIRRMSLKDLAGAAFDKGFTWKVLPDGGLVEGLTIQAGPPEMETKSV